MIWDNIYYYLFSGFFQEDTTTWDKKQIRQKYLVCQQIEKSNKIKLKKARIKKKFRKKRKSF